MLYAEKSAFMLRIIWSDPVTYVMIKIQGGGEGGEGHNHMHYEVLLKNFIKHNHTMC